MRNETGTDEGVAGGRSRSEEEWRSRSYLRQLRLDGKGYVVLGVGSGIGGQVCRALREAGARLICVDINEDVARSAAATCDGVALTGDVTRRGDLEMIFEQARTEFGPRFAGVVDVVGVALLGTLTSYDDATIDQQFDLVLRHALVTVQIAAPMLAANGGGSITLVGSIAGHVSTPRIALYGMAKAALHHLAAAAAHEFGPYGVRVNAVAPGRIVASGTVRPDAERLKIISSAIPLRRVGVPADIAGIILFLASDLAGYITGTVIHADGGIGRVSALPGSSP